MSVDVILFLSVIMSLSLCLRACFFFFFRRKAQLKSNHKYIFLHFKKKNRDSGDKTFCPPFGINTWH